MLSALPPPNCTKYTFRYLTPALGNAVVAVVGDLTHFEGHSPFLKTDPT